MSTAWQEWKKRNAEKQQAGIVSPLDFVNPDTQYAATELIDERYEICQQCPQLMVSKQCRECGCFMPAKTKLLHAKCPIGKW
jgi:hypothetical protein